MGSGVLLAILVALWFVVLVPMVVTRGDLASAPAESMRVLRRRSDRRAMSNSPMSNETTAGSTSRDRALPHDAVPAGALGARPSRSDPRSSEQTGPRRDTPTTGVENLLTEPIPTPSSRRRTLRSRARTVDPPPADEPTRGEIDIRARRRRLLTGMVALALLWALFAAFWQPVLWWPQIVLDLAVFSYLVFLRLEAQREQDREERRRARDSARVRLPEDRTERVVRAHTEYQAQVSAASEHRSIALDDDDPNLSEMPVWQAADPAGTDREQAPHWTTRKAV